MQALILDLRNNPGGLLNSAVDVCAQFLPPNTVVVSTQGRAASQEREYTTSSTAKERPHFPLAVLVNEGSASGAEIVSGALKDLKRALLVGETTFGKGSVQNVLQLPDGSALRFTTAKYYTPGKQVIHGNGVTPTIAVPMTAEQEHALFVSRNNDTKIGDEKTQVRSRDPQMLRAIDALKGVMIYEQEKFGGVVPEVASRNHLAQLPRLLERVMASANTTINKIDAFAATSGPGLASSLLVGNSAAKGLAIGADKPFLAINHLEGHLLSPFFGSKKIEPNIGLVVSGGHTLLVNVRGVGNYEILGRTLDDAAGEAFDKVAKLLGLGYPGGPEIEMRAQKGDAKKFELPRSMLNSGDLNFSFSGLKTAVRYLLPKVVIPNEVEGSRAERFKVTYRDPSTDSGDDVLADLCASFQQAVIDVLREKSLRALQQTKSRRLTLSGGVSCNRALRENLRAACQKNGIAFLVAEPWLCTDNAAMIAFRSEERRVGKECRSRCGRDHGKE